MTDLIAWYNQDYKQNFQKGNEIFEYVWSNIKPYGATFLQETHSLANVEKKSQDDFQGHILFSHS